MMLSSFSHLNAQKISKLSDMRQYETLFVDIVGVMYDGRTPYNDAVSAINTAKESGRNVVFISNNPRPSSLSQSNLTKMGINGDLRVITSGDYTRWYLQQYYLGKTIYHLGAACNQDILKDLEVLTTDDIDQADIILLTQFIEESDSSEQFDHILTKIAQSKKPVFCANPDVFASYGNTLRKCAGYFAKQLEIRGKNVKYLGKPNVEFYEYVCYTQNINTNNKNNILMIGDTIDTDIKGANTFGIDSLLVLSGISSDFDVNKHLEYSCQPTYYMDKLI